MAGDIDILMGELQKSLSKANSRDDNDSGMELTNDNIAEFIMKYVGVLVKDSIEVVSEAKKGANTGDPETIESIASAIKASTAPLDLLQKIMVSREKSKVSKELKLMSIESADKAQNKELGTRILLSHSEAMKKLFQDAEELYDKAPIDEDDRVDVIDGEVVP